MSKTFYERLNKSRPTYQRVSDLETLKREPTSNSTVSYTEFRNSIQNMYHLVRKIIEANPDITNQELSQNIFNLLNQLNVEYGNSPTFRSDSLRLDMCDYFISKPYEFKEIYNEMIEEERRTKTPIQADEIIQYSSNIEMSKRQFMSQIITTFRRTKKSIEDQSPETAKFLKRYAFATPKQRREFKALQESRSAKDYISESEKFFGDEFTGLESYLREIRGFLASELKKDYIDSITNTITQLETFTSFDDYLDKHNSQVQEIGLNGLTIDKKTFQEAYSRENLQKLPISNLASLNAFWVNRFTKEILDFNSAFFTVNSLSLWSHIRTAKPLADGTYDINITDEQIKAIGDKRRFLSSIANEYFQSIFGGEIDLSELESDEFTDTRTGIVHKRKSAINRDLTDEIKDLNDEIGEDYTRFFSRTNNNALSECDNNFIDDFTICSLTENTRFNSYSIKSNIMIALLSNLFNNSSFSRNWGLYLEKNSNNTKFLLPRENTSKVLIGIDVPRFKYAS